MNRSFPVLYHDHDLNQSTSESSTQAHKQYNFVHFFFFPPRREKPKVKPYSKYAPTSWTVCHWPTSIRSTTGCHTKRLGLKSDPCALNDPLVRHCHYYVFKTIIIIFIHMLIIIIIFIVFLFFNEIIINFFMRFWVKQKNKYIIFYDFYIEVLIN